MMKAAMQQRQRQVAACRVAADDDPARIDAGQPPSLAIADRRSTQVT
jgi:hypothetical protein